MNIARRGFLSLLGAGAAGLALPLPKVLTWEPSLTAFPAGVPVVGLDAMGQRVLEAFLRNMSPIVGGVTSGTHMIGQVLHRGIVATDQLSVSAEAWAPGTDMKAEHYDWIGEKLAKGARHHNMHLFGRLERPSELLCATGYGFDPRSGVSVRAISQYDVGLDLMRLRFDVIGARA